MTLKQIPIPVTFGVFKDFLLLDPTLQEESYIDGYIRTVILDDGSVQYMSQRSGGEETSGLNAKKCKEVLELCAAKTAAMRDSLQLHVGVIE